MFINGSFTVFLYYMDLDSPSDVFEEGYIIDIPATSLTVLYLIDLIANFVVLGPKKSWTDRKTLYLELLL